MTAPTLEQACDLVRQLSVQEKLYLLNALTTQLIHDTTNMLTAKPLGLPIFHVAHWSEDTLV